MISGIAGRGSPLRAVVVDTMLHILIFPGYLLAEARAL
jgi:hypothetical protein